MIIVYILQFFSQQLKRIMCLIIQSIAIETHKIPQRLVPIEFIKRRIKYITVIVLPFSFVVVIVIVIALNFKIQIVVVLLTKPPKKQHIVVYWLITLLEKKPFGMWIKIKIEKRCIKTKNQMLLKKTRVDLFAYLIWRVSWCPRILHHGNGEWWLLKLVDGWNL